MPAAVSVLASTVQQIHLARLHLCAAEASLRHHAGSSFVT